MVNENFNGEWIMSKNKNNSKNAARQRRRAHQKQLVASGRQAEDLVSAHRQQAADAVARAARLEAEAAEARKALGAVTNQWVEADRELKSKTLMLEGMRGELELAARVVDSVRLVNVRRELEIARAADIDAKSLRFRLQRKSEEIESLKSRLREAQAALADFIRANSVRGFDHAKEEGIQVKDRGEGMGG